MTPGRTARFLGRRDLAFGSASGAVPLLRNSRREAVVNRPSNVVNEGETSEREASEGRFRTWARDLGRAAGSVNVGLQRFVVYEGHQSLPEHNHMAEEELFYVLRGRGTLLQGGERIPVGAGDVISFPAGTGAAHAFLADRGEDLEYLAIGERNENDVIVYPRSEKILIRALNQLGRMGEAGYWDGER
jgi:uncharacterized cupin superfamily protein